MPQVQISSSNIDTFIFNATFNIYERNVVFDISQTTYNGGGAANVLGVAFSLIDQDGVELAVINWSAPQIPDPDTTTSWTLDLSSVNYAFLFQTYQIIGAIQDQGGAIYQTTPVYKKVCQPVDFTESGYVPGLFNITADCPNNVLTVKELTALVYNNTKPISTTKTGTLSYPTGTISGISFNGTPFSNDVIYTGQYRINCETVATYDLGDEVYVAITYLTNNVFDITCSNKMADLMCCIISLEQNYIKNCNTAIGKNAKQQLDEIAIPFMVGITKEISGQDASEQADFIRKKLRCDCGVNSIHQNEMTPINPSVYNIVIQGVGGTSVAAPTVIGNTKTFNVASNVYQVVKGDVSDLSFSIQIDTATPNTVKYKITFNYDVLAATIYTATANNPTLLNQLNNLVNATGVNLTGLNGSCVINLNAVDYAVSQAVTGSTIITNIVINGNIYNAPINLFANNTVAVQNWLNSLTLGTFSAVVNTGTLTIQSVNNTNVISTISFTSPAITKQFAATNASLVEVLQAIIDYLCNLTALQMALGNNLSLCLFDYNGQPITTQYAQTVKQSDFNLGISQAICNIVSRINTLTAITCARIKSLFTDNVNASFSGNGRVYGIDGAGNCVSFTNEQVALGVINAINSASAVKTQFCAIDCTVPGSCPNVANFSMAMAGSNIGIYGVTWATSTLATQTVTVAYKLTSSSTWIIATNSLLILPNGNISGTTPFQIINPTPGQTYDVWVYNNCGGAGNIKQILIPTGSVFSDSFLLDTVIYNICGESPVTLYSSSIFAPGVTMYSDIGLTVPVTGFTYIANVNTGGIFEINSGTGVVGIDTGSSCASGVAGTYRLGNSTGSICAASLVTLYTNGAFTIGGTLYNDSGLTSPVTGSSFVVNNSNNIIYNLNSGSGVIGASTGLSCSTGTIIIDNQTSALIPDDLSIAYLAPPAANFVISLPILPGNSAAGTHGAFTGILEVGIFTPTDPPGNWHLQMFINGILIECVEVQPNAGGIWPFTSRTYNATDLIEIGLFQGPC